MSKLDALATECAALATVTSPAEKPKKKKRSEADLLRGMDMGPAAGGMAGEMVAQVELRSRKRVPVTSLLSEMCADQEARKTRSSAKKQKVVETLIEKKSKQCFDFVNTKHVLPKEALDEVASKDNNQKEQDVSPLEKVEEVPKDQEINGTSELPVAKKQGVIIQVRQDLEDREKNNQKEQDVSPLDKVDEVQKNQEKSPKLLVAEKQGVVQVLQVVENKDKNKQETLVASTAKGTEKVYSSKEQDFMSEAIAMEKKKLDEMLMKIGLNPENLRNLQIPETDNSTITLKEPGTEDPSTLTDTVIADTPSSPQEVVAEPAPKSPVMIAIVDSEVEEDQPQAVQHNTPSIESLPLSSPYSASTSTSASTPSPFGAIQGPHDHDQPIDLDLWNEVMRTRYALMFSRKSLPLPVVSQPFQAMTQPFAAMPQPLPVVPQPFQTKSQSFAAMPQQIPMVPQPFSPMPHNQPFAQMPPPFQAMSQFGDFPPNFMLNQRFQNFNLPGPSRN